MPRSLLPLLPLCLVALSCSYYNANLLQPGADASASGTAGAGNACAHALPPDKPAVSDAGGELDLVFALRSISFGELAEPGAAAVGWDIDKTCTCQGEADSCLQPSWATADHCDGLAGRDNGFGALLGAAAKLVADFGEAAWNQRLERGNWSLLVRVRNYNGQPDDDEVSLEWYIPDAFFAIIKEQDGGKPSPRFDGTDEWPVRSFCVENGDVNQPKYLDPKAYVSGGMLVGMLPTGIIDSEGWFRMVLTDTYVTGRLVEADGGWELREGNVAAVWTLQDIFTELGYLTISGIPMCAEPGNQAYQVFKGMICKHVDIYRSRGTATTACDSLSIGMGFETVRARLGGLTVSVPKASACDPAHNPANDSCGTGP